MALQYLLDGHRYVIQRTERIEHICNSVVRSLGTWQKTELLHGFLCLEKHLYSDDTIPDDVILVDLDNDTINGIPASEYKTLNNVESCSDAADATDATDATATASVVPSISQNTLLRPRTRSESRRNQSTRTRSESNSKQKRITKALR